MDFLVQRVPLESKAPLELRGIKALQGRSVYPVRTALVETLAPMVTLDQTDPQERRA